LPRNGPAGVRSYRSKVGKLGGGVLDPPVSQDIERSEEGETSNVPKHPPLSSVGGQGGGPRGSLANLGDSWLTCVVKISFVLMAHNGGGKRIRQLTIFTEGGDVREKINKPENFADETTVISWRSWGLAKLVFSRKSKTRRERIFSSRESRGIISENRIQTYENRLWGHGAWGKTPFKIPNNPEEGSCERKIKKN